MRSLSPAEQATVDRFGLFDPDVIEEHERWWGYTLTCCMPHCERPTAMRITMVCCTAGAEFCASHGARALRKMRRRLKRRGQPECLQCHYKFRAGATLDDVVRVVHR